MTSDLSRSQPSPFHVLYGGAHLFKEGVVDKLADRALTTMETWGHPDAVFAKVVGLENADDAALSEKLAWRVRQKLRSERAIEAMCIDFEDGYGIRRDEEEDADAVRTAEALAKTAHPDTLIGIRIKSFGAEGPRGRALRTLERFVMTYAERTGGLLRSGFSVTLPKVTRASEVTKLADALDELEKKIGLSQPTIDIELMIESPRALLDDEGRVPIRHFVYAGRGRVVAAHLGAYDLTAEMGVTGSDQRLDHPYCDHARTVMSAALADSIVRVVDGATTLMPIPPKDASDEESAAAVHRAWSVHANNVRRSIQFGIWQSWDLHPAQLPARYGALFAYFLIHKDDHAARFKRFMEQMMQATRVGQDFDDAATGRGLSSFFERGLACGALERGEVEVAIMPPLQSSTMKGAR